MGNLIKRYLVVSALVILGVALKGPSAWAGDVDCPPDACAFLGTAPVASVGATTIGPSGGTWSGIFSEDVYLNSGVYTYVFDLSLTSMATNDSLVSLSTGLGASVADFFNSGSGFNWGVIFAGVTGNPFTATSTGVNDTGFSFTGSTLQTGLSGMNAAGKTFEFYAQSTLGPGAGQFNALDGGTTSTGSLDPGPEPSSILLFGTGLLVLGAILRRRLPQLQQPL